MLIHFALFFYFAEKGRVQRPTVNSSDIQDNLALVLLALFFLLPIIAFFCLKKCIKAREEKMTSFLFGLFGFVCEKKSVSKSILTESGLFEKKLFLREDNSFWGQFLNTKFSVSEYNINALGFDVDKRTFQNRLYIKIDLKKRYLAHTQVINQKMPLANFSTKVNLEDVDFIKEFDVFSTDQIEARTILNPAFIEKLKRLKKTFSGNRIDVAFFNNIALFAINTPDDVFQVFPYEKIILDLSFYERFYEEVKAIYDMIEVLQIENNEI